MEELDLKILLQMFGKQKKQIICIILLFMTIGVIYTMFFVTPVYSSSTSLILSTSENNSTNLEISTTTATELNVNSKLVSTYTELVKSKKILGKVISNLNLNITEDALKKKVSVQPVEDADFIKITVVNPNAEQAAQIANEIANVFIEDGVKQYYKMDNVQVVDKAEPSLRPSNINKKRDILIFIGIGIVVSVIYVIVLNMLDNTIKTVEDIEGVYSFPVLVSIPKCDGDTYAKRRRK